ncbi:hypothetical protein [uncultured Pseudacidovorax sp.]|uniref:hypothetical protein n=1 Tax=uncultured Pseudacidovorax sp. TaxID=679313 RepID=UPI0025D24433|nr:hypothetical protein [uncultured Pseudacidovorax sp.]
MQVRLRSRRALVRCAGALLLAASPWVAFAHGDWPPKHGGVMNDGETSFELVQRRDGLHFYVEDHGERVRMAGSTPTLLVRRNGTERTHAGKPQGDNVLFFAGVRLHPSDDVMVRVTFAHGATAVGRFPPLLRARVSTASR